MNAWVYPTVLLGLGLVLTGVALLGVRTIRNVIPEAQRPSYRRVLRGMRLDTYVPFRHPWWRITQRCRLIAMAAFFCLLASGIWAYALYLLQ